MSKIFLTEVQSITVALRDVLILVLITGEIKLYFWYYLTSLVKVAYYYKSLCFGSPYNRFHTKSIAYGIISTAAIWNMITQT